VRGGKSHPQLATYRSEPWMWGADAMDNKSGADGHRYLVLAWYMEEVNANQRTTSTIM
jgi:hypothetical protein